LVSLEESQTTVLSCIPVTTVSRTITDLDRSGARNEARRARREADFRGLEYVAAGQDRTASRLEAALLALCRRKAIPLPEVNVPIGPYVVDFLWRHAMLIVETDGWAAHRARSAFERDRGRDLHLSQLGYRVLRFSARQVAEDAQEIASLLRYHLKLVG
jgi:very-short-patch-repair endonuclease